VAAIAGSAVSIVDEGAIASRELRKASSRQRRATVLVGSWRVLVLLLLLGCWYAASGRLVSSLFVSNPVHVAKSFADETRSGVLLKDARVTLLEVLIGYSIGVGAALAAALLLSTSHALQRIVRPFLMAFYAIPKVALAPLMIMWFGLGTRPKVILAALFVFFVVFMSTLAGLEAVAKNLVNVARVMGANRRQLLFKIIFPSAIPNVVTALRIAIPGAMSGAIIGEFMAGNAGLGYLVQSAGAQFAAAPMLAGIFAILIIVLIIDSALAVAERSLLQWRPTALGRG
jgi:NitT/TauT family transport system permease protein